MNKHFSSKIIDWYLIHKRNLPWRESKDPYTIWLSEIILQQTRVAQGLPYFNKFIDKYPTVEAFSSAEEDEILKMWQGLGYYSRARNMMACAKTIIAEYDGNFPTSYDELLKLKGIGRYTAAAIASFSFDEAVPVVDGNVFRVLSRIFGLVDDISDSKSYLVFFNRAQELMGESSPSLFNQSIMEFGALHCTPKNYDCEPCVFSNSCFAKQNEMQNDLPVKSKKIKKRKRFFYYFIIKHKDSLLIKKRSSGDIWNGLYDFLLIEKKATTDEKSIIKENELLSKFEISSSNKEYKHILTHQTIFARFYQIDVKSKDDFEVIKNAFSLISIESDSISNYPISKLIDNFLNNDYF